MSKSFKLCPICGAVNHPNASMCATCGTTLTDIDITEKPTRTQPPEAHYDYRYGESDLREDDLRRVGQRLTAGLLGGILLLVLGGLTLAFAPTLAASVTDTTGAVAVEATLSTATPRAELSLPTVTPAPPTRTPTQTVAPTATITPSPTREPCFQQVTSGDTLYGLALNCGHRGTDVLPLIQEINGLTDVNSIREGQVLEIPWPTDTPDPNAVTDDPPVEASGDTETADTGQTDAERSALDLSEEELLFNPTATLQPGMQFHTVQDGENILDIGRRYGADLETMSQLNPEVTFSQCDFGSATGGPRCTVLLNQGQVIRVPAPTPTPTTEPTASGSETPTPSPTATFNAPSLLSPSNRTPFDSDELITLRWVPTGTLGTDENYVVTVEDMTAGVVYTAATLDPFYVIPTDWQGTNGQRHEYNWTVSIVNQNNPQSPSYTTETYTFTWESRE